MRGVTAIFEYLIIIMILISIVTLFWLFASGTIEELTQTGTERTETTREILSSCMIVESAYENKLFIKNCGEGVIVNDSLNVYLDDEILEFNMTPETIKKGEIGTITTNLFGVSLGFHDLKITNPNLQFFQKIEIGGEEGMGIIPDYTLLALDFDENLGIITYDKSINENHGDLFNSPSWVTGRFGSALNFVEGGTSGTSSSCGNHTCVNTTSFDPFSVSEITVSAWIKQKTYNTCEIVVIRRTTLTENNGASFRFGLGGTCHYGSGAICDTNNPNPIIFQVWNPGSSSTVDYFWSDETVSLNTWHHIMVNYNGNTINFYLDGENVGTISYSEQIRSGPDSRFIIGAGDGTCQGGFNGIIDSVRVYSKSLTPAETTSSIFKLK